MFDPHKNQWWNAPPRQRFEAYYMTLRVHYGMTALEAYTMAKENFDQVNALMSSVRYPFKPIVQG